MCTTLRLCRRPAHRIAIIDDVLTTGSTVELAHVLKPGGDPRRDKVAARAGGQR
jgi:predicted amidophosphoribosyltransferase